MVKTDFEVDSRPAQVVWSRQCRKLLSFHLCTSWTRSLTFFPLDPGLKSVARNVLVPTAQCDTQPSSCSTRKASFVFLFPWLACASPRACVQVVFPCLTTGAVVWTVQNSGVVVQFLDKVVRCPFLQRQEPWSTQCRKPEFYKVWTFAPQLQFVEGRRHPCCAAEADPHGPVCSEDHRDSAVAMLLSCGRCPCCAGRASFSGAGSGGPVVIPRLRSLRNLL